jgi:hypothetical protein
MEKKICKKCNEEKNLCEFRQYKKKKSNNSYNVCYRGACKKCENDSSKKYYQNNIEIIRSKSKIFYEKNKQSELNRRKEHYTKNRERELQNMKKYREKNKQYFVDYNKKYQKNYENNRLKTDIMYKLSKNIRRRLVLFLNTKNLSKNNKTFDIIGCTPQFLKEYLESKFQDGMTWENYGYYGWHLDHIIPLSTAKNVEELYLLCNYTNLQPLWGIDNIKKSNKLII